MFQDIQIMETCTKCYMKCPLDIMDFDINTLEDVLFIRKYTHLVVKIKNISRYKNYQINYIDNLFKEHTLSYVYNQVLTCQYVLKKYIRPLKPDILYFFISVSN